MSSTIYLHAEQQAKAYVETQSDGFPVLNLVTDGASVSLFGPNPTFCGPKARPMEAAHVP